MVVAFGVFNPNGNPCLYLAAGFGAGTNGAAIHIASQVPS
jgi:hypothetical protein